MTNENSPAKSGWHSHVCLLRLPEVTQRVALSKSEIYRRIAAGDFPRAIKLGERASAWNAAEVDSWIAARIAARDAGRVVA